MSKMGDRIGRLIFEKGITQREFADIVGVTEVTMARIVRGKTAPKAPILANIAKALNVSVNYLVTGDKGESEH